MRRNGPTRPATARDALARWDDLTTRTFAFRDACSARVSPPAIIDAASSTLALLRTSTVIRLEGGELWAWEGLHKESGSCRQLHPCVELPAGPALAVPRSSSARCATPNGATISTPNGGLAFRQRLPLGSGLDIIGPASDGHFGAIIKTFREWKLGAGTDWLAISLAAGQASRGICVVRRQPRSLGP